MPATMTRRTRHTGHDRRATPERLWAAADFFVALGEPTRLQMVLALRDGGESMSMDQLGQFCATYAGCHYHLTILRFARIVQARRENRRLIYTLDKSSPASGLLRVIGL